MVIFVIKSKKEEIFFEENYLGNFDIFFSIGFTINKGANRIINKLNLKLLKLNKCEGNLDDKITYSFFHNRARLLKIG
jgi:hypothetical protein